MSDLLNKASLVMVPSGYKEDTVYSVVPSDGSGDLSFTRASNGTRINSAGLVEVCPWNLVQYSEDITNAVWGEFGATRSANTATAPNGTTTADTILPSATTSTHGIFQQITVANGIYSASAYFKANGYNYACIRIATNSDTTRYGVVISLIDGSVTATDTSGSPTNTSYSIETAGNGWFKLNVSCSHSSGFIYHTVGVSNVAVPTFANSLPSFTANGTSSIYIWGAQLNIGSTAKPYFPTTDRLNVPRLTYQNGGGGCPSLLLEKQSTNKITQSDTFTAGVSGTSITINNGISPDGTQNAPLISGSSGYAYIGASNLFGNGVTTTFSSFIKYKQGVGNVSIGIGGAFNAYLFVSGLNGNSPTITGSYGGATNGSVGMVSYGNGWYRVYLTATYTGTPGYQEYQVSGNGTNTEFWHYNAQIEDSAYMTSPIKTSGSSATRVADYAYKTSATALIGQSEGTLFADFVTGGLPSVDQYYMNISDGSTSNIVYIGFYSNILVARVIDAGSLVVNINVALATNTRYKVGFAYKANDCILYINGSNSGSDTSASIPACSKLSYNDFSNEACYQLNESVLFKTRLTNAELASLTTI